MKTILEDARDIDGIYWNDADGTSYKLTAQPAHSPETSEK